MKINGDRDGERKKEYFKTNGRSVSQCIAIVVVASLTVTLTVSLTLRL